MNLSRKIKIFFLKKNLKSELRLIFDNIVIFSGVFFSRITGFFRDIMFAHIFGIGAISDAFLAASKLPNSFRRIFADGGLLISFIPVFVKEKEKNQQESLIFAGRILSLISIIVIVFVIICFIFMPTLIKITNPGFLREKNIFDNAVKFGRISIFFLFIATISSLMCGILNAIRQFLYNAYHTIIYNLVLIFAAFFCLLFLKNSLEERATFISFALILAGIISGLFIASGLKKNKLKLIPQKPRFDKQEKEVLSGIFYSIFSFIKVLFDSIFASFFFGGISFLYYADRVVNFPSSLIGYTLSASILPILSKKFFEKNAKEFTKILFLSFNFIVVLTFPVIFVLYFFNHEIIYFIYGNSKIQIEDLHILANILKITAFSIMSNISAKVLTSAFFASSNQRMSFIINISNLSINAILILFFMKKYNIYSLFISNVIVNILNFSMMFIFLYRKKIITKFYDKNLFLHILVSLSICIISLLIVDEFSINDLTNKLQCFKKIFLFGIIYCIIALPIFSIKNFKKFKKN